MYISFTNVKNTKNYAVMLTLLSDVFPTLMFILDELLGCQYSNPTTQHRR